MNRRPFHRCLGALSTLLLMLCAEPAAWAQTAPVAPSITSITFAPASIASGGTSRLTINFGNGNATAATLTAALTDTLPLGLTVAAGGASNSCPSAAVAGNGATTIVYPSGAAIPAGGCSIGVNVTATSKTIRTAYTDTIPAAALITNLGSNLAAASATLTVQSAVAVPNLVGLSQSQAATLLQSVGLVLGTIAHAPGPSGIPFNAIFGQNPAAGASVADGSAVAINLSTGPGKASNLAAPLTSVPNFVEPTQVSVASAFERLCALLDSPGQLLNASQRNLLANCTAILGTYGGGSDAAGLKGALDAISGKTATAQQTQAVRFAGSQFTNIGTRLAQLRQETTNPSFADINLGLPMPAGSDQLLSLLKDLTGYQGESPFDGIGGGSAGDDSGPSAFGRFGFFLYGNRRTGSQETTDLETGFDFRETGFTGGVDYRITNSWILGLSFDNSTRRSTFDSDNGRLDARDTAGSIYTTFYADDLYIDMIGTYGHIRYNSQRTSVFSIAPNSTTTPTNCGGTQCSIDSVGSTAGRQMAFDLALGYGFHAGALTFGPDVAVDYTGIRVDGYTESDPNSTGLALAYDPQSGESLLFKGGGNVSYAISTPIGVLIPKVRAQFVHEFDNNQRTLIAHFVQDPTASTPGGPISNFAVFTDQPTRNYLDWGADLSAQFPYGIAGFVDYSAVTGNSQIHTNQLTIGARVQFAF